MVFSTRKDASECAGAWTYAAAVWLSSAIGMHLTEYAFASGEVPRHDALRAGTHSDKVK